MTTFKMYGTDKGYKIVFEDERGYLVHGPHSVLWVPKNQTREIDKLIMSISTNQ